MSQVDEQWDRLCPVEGEDAGDPQEPDVDDSDEDADPTTGRYVSHSE